jgi:hypothetical protein
MGGERGCWLLLALALGCLLAQPCRAASSSFFGARGAYYTSQFRVRFVTAFPISGVARVASFLIRSLHRVQSRGVGGYRDEKVPMTVVVPDYSPRPAPTPAPAPVPGADTDGMPQLPSERRAPSSSIAGAPAGATSTDFISSNPAVPLPAGVTDSATVLPLPTPGQQRRVSTDHLSLCFLFLGRTRFLH